MNNNGYTAEQVGRLIDLMELLDIPLYNETTIAEMKALVKHKLLAEYSIRVD